MTMDSSKTITVTFEDKLKWSRRSYGQEAPAIGTEGLIYVHNPNWEGIAAFAPAGNVVWRQGSFSSIPSLDHSDNVYINSYRSIRSYSADGTLRWDERTGDRFPPDVGIASPLTLAADRVWGLGPQNDYWVFTYEGAYVTNFVVAGIPIADSQGNTYFPTLKSFTRDGELRWEIPDGGEPFAVVEDIIYTIADDAIHTYRSDSSFVRSYSFSSSIKGSPIIGPDGTIYAGTQSGLEALLANGEPKWTSDLAAPYLTLAQDGTLYVSNEGLISLDSASGEINWRHPIPYYHEDPGSGPAVLRGDFAPAIGLNGDIYLTRIQGSDIMTMGFFYAIEGNSPIAQGGWPTYRGNQQRTGQWLAGSAQPVALEAFVSGENIILQASGFPLAEYELQTSTNLIDWETVGTVTGAGTIQLPNDQDFSFFRLVKA